MSKEIRTSLAEGDQLGRYRIVRQIGAGGMSTVFEAEHVDLGKPVALKALLPQLEGSDEVRARMLREGKAASSIRHPHVVDISDVGEFEGITYLVMELLEGEDLSGRLRRRGALGVAETADILVPVMAGLAAAHGVGVLHRDLKPGNIFITRGPYGEEVPKLVDFGIAKDLSLSEAKPLTETGRVIGTPYYMSPEQVTASPKLDGRSDVYSMGVILYHCLCGVAPFRGESLYTVMTEVVQGSFQTIDSVRPDLPADLCRIVMTAMATDRDRRWPTVSRLGQELAAFASPQVRDRWGPIFSGVSQTPKLAVAESPAPLEAALHTGQVSAAFDARTPDLPSRSRSSGWLVLALLLVVLAAGGWWWTSRGPGVESAPIEAGEVRRLPLRGVSPLDAEDPGAMVPPPDSAEEPKAEALAPEPKDREVERPVRRRPPLRRRAPEPKPEPKPEREAKEAITGTEKPSPKPRAPEASPKKDVELGTNDAPILN